MGEESALSKFMSLATRGPRRETFERLAVLKLVKANNVNPLRRIRFLCEAGWMLRNELKKREEELDVGFIEELYTVALALDSTRSNNQTFYSVPWGIPATEENFKRYIEPWWNCELYYYPDMLSICKEAWFKVECNSCGYRIYDIYYPDLQLNQESEKTKQESTAPNPEEPPLKCPVCGSSFSQPKGSWATFGQAVGTIREPLRTGVYYRAIFNPTWRFFFDATRCLSNNGYKQLCNNYVGWANPIVTMLEAHLSTLISPQVFMEVYETEKGGKAEVEDTMGSRA